MLSQRTKDAAKASTLTTKSSPRQQKKNARYIAHSLNQALTRLLPTTTLDDETSAMMRNRARNAFLAARTRNHQDFASWNWLLFPPGSSNPTTTPDTKTLAPPLFPALQCAPVPASSYHPVPPRLRRQTLQWRWPQARPPTPSSTDDTPRAPRLRKQQQQCSITHKLFFNNKPSSTLPHELMKLANIWMNVIYSSIHDSFIGPPDMCTFVPRSSDVIRWGMHVDDNWKRGDWVSWGPRDADKVYGIQLFQTLEPTSVGVSSVSCLRTNKWFWMVGNEWISSKCFS